ncbi:hypothetical protein ABEF95_011113 [Exophiala dermatitidis]
MHFSLCFATALLLALFGQAYALPPPFTISEFEADAPKPLAVSDRLYQALSYQAVQFDQTPLNQVGRLYQTPLHQADRLSQTLLYQADLFNQTQLNPADPFIHAKLLCLAALYRASLYQADLSNLADQFKQADPSNRVDPFNHAKSLNQVDPSNHAHIPPTPSRMSTGAQHSPATR